ncbi:PadR family transcriptional regulator [Clostridium botulinum]|nr:PadR family transcriptional regulator [Clostridium botulinum]MBY6821059.1 PadR family transcriptional regulator [Clostridium botulinum]NFJ50206.1 PadR family transcriptional regulator [Clostridium botulinum]NFL07590.1 PadR family transcriptional regulator [Clostridium botulinum]NFP06562.1 PadR family transcriptional regulator [Clostridium botulinum]
MNMLSYGPLVFWENESTSGYELTIKMNLFWYTRHSHIYPLLAKLEEDGYVEFILINQSGKPDKKVYTPTKKGLEATKKWLEENTADPITKDEMLLKTYCLHILGEDMAKKLLKEREEMYHKKFITYQNKIEALKEEGGKKLTTTNSGYFTRFVILNKILGDAKWLMVGTISPITDFHRLACAHGRTKIKGSDNY